MEKQQKWFKTIREFVFAGPWALVRSAPSLSAALGQNIE